MMRDGAAREVRVGLKDERFSWVETGTATEEMRMLSKVISRRADRWTIFLRRGSNRWNGWSGSRGRSRMDTFSASTTAIRAAELARFPGGTLMSYRRHQALDDVLKDPGEQDITAHVCFSALEEYGKTVAWNGHIRAAGANADGGGRGGSVRRGARGGSPAEEQRRRLQLKQLLFGMGETFRTLMQRKGGQK